MLLPTALSNEQVEVSTTALSNHVRLQAWDRDVSGELNTPWGPDDEYTRLADLRFTANQARDLAAALTRAANDADRDVNRDRTVTKYADDVEVGDKVLLDGTVYTVAARRTVDRYTEAQQLEFSLTSREGDRTANYFEDVRVQVVL